MSVISLQVMFIMANPSPASHGHICVNPDNLKVPEFNCCHLFVLRCRTMTVALSEHLSTVCIWALCKDRKRSYFFSKMDLFPSYTRFFYCQVQTSCLCVIPGFTWQGERERKRKTCGRFRRQSVAMTLGRSSRLDKVTVVRSRFPVYIPLDTALHHGC